MRTPKRSRSFTSKKTTSKRPAKSPQAKRPSYPTLTVSFVSVEVKHNGWPGEGVKATDLSLILQLEDPAAAAGNAALASARLPFAASSGETVSAADLPPDLNGVPFFGGPVK